MNDSSAKKYLFIIFSAIAFICIWFNAFIFRDGRISKIGTIILLLICFAKLLEAFFNDKYSFKVGVSLTILTVCLHQYAIRDVLLMMLIFWAFYYIQEVRSGFLIALKVFLMLGVITIILSFLGVGNSPQWGIGRIIGRYRLGFVTSYHLAEFFLVFCFFCFFYLNKKSIYVISSILLIIALIISGSRVGIISFIAVVMMFLFKKYKYVWKGFFTLGIVANIALILWLCQSGFYQNISSSRNVIIHAIASIYSQYFNLLTIAIGIINDSRLADLVNNPSWVTSVPIDGIGMKMFATGIIGAILALSFLVYLYFKSVSRTESYFLLISILFLGLGSDMLNTWHIITFFLFYSICEPNSKPVPLDSKNQQVSCV